MPRDTGAATPRPSSLTAQLQQAWLQTQIPKTRSASVSSTTSSSSFVSLRLGSKKPENVSTVKSSLVSDEGTPHSTVSLDSTSSAGLSDWNSQMLELDQWDIHSPDPGCKTAPDSPRKKLPRFDTGLVQAAAAADYTNTAYVDSLLNDRGLLQSRCMLQECLAYQALHEELSDIVGGFQTQALLGGEGKVDSSVAAAEAKKVSRQDTDFVDWLDKGSKPEDMENWIASLFNGPPALCQGEGDDFFEDVSVFSKSGSGQQDEGDGGGVFLHGPERALVPPTPDLNELLLQCSRAVAVDDVLRANESMKQIRQLSSPYGNGVQRLAHYFTEGLLARLSGTGADLYSAGSASSASALIRAYHLLETKCPYVSVAHLFCNQTLLDAFEGASRVHVVDYGMTYGFQWPHLIKELAERPGGPPRLRITGVDFPQPGFKPAERLEETGKRLAELATLLGVPFEFQAVASKWEAVQPSALALRHDEVLAVNTVYRLRHLLDESVSPASPRKAVLSKIRGLNPKVLLTGVISGGYNVPFFLSRFRECLHYYSYIFDSLDTVVPRDCEVRGLLEKEILGREILNVVACEGTERVERPEPYTQWQRRLQNAGFKLKPLTESLRASSRRQLCIHHKDFSTAEDAGWMLLGWKNQVVKALASWELAD